MLKPNINISVIIPTFNRKNTLTKCLHALFDQTYPKKNYELIVIDDGSTDGTGEIMNTLLSDAPCIMKYFRQVNSGPAAARNVGIKMAQGEIVLLIDDDIIAASSLLESHFNWHQKYSDDKTAVLGYVEWSHDINVTPFMRWLDNGGPQFSYNKIFNETDVDPARYFYSCNISLKKKLLTENGEFFDEEFLIAGWEDIELGNRLKKRGVVLKFNKEAKAYHFRTVALSNYCRRMFKVGQTSHILARKIQQGEKKVNAGSTLRKYFKKIKLILKYPKFRLYYKLAKYYENRAIKTEIFKFTINYCYKRGALNMKDLIRITEK
ncbi:MAG: glycosyltransferase [Nitrospirota bacterium]|nr:glycosyltransferase [Nitrospirota bacterium]